MTTIAHADLPTRFFEGQDRLKGALPPECVAPGYRAEIAGFPAMDAAGHGAFGTAFYAGFPDLSHAIDETFVSGDRVVTRFNLRGTHTGDFLGIPPTGRSIDVPAIAVFTVAGGRVTRLQGVFDRFGLMQQLGVVG